MKMDEQKKVRVTMNQYPQHEKKHDLEHYLTPKKSNPKSSFLTFNGRTMLAKMVKPILLAVFLGVIFGAGLIYYFSDLSPDAVPVTTVDQDDEESNEQQSSGEGEENGEAFSKPSTEYEVIQFGLFSSQENADELVQDKLKPNSIPAIVQEDGGQYYVISHLVSEEAEKSSVTDWLESTGLVYMEDFFYKSWGFDRVSLNVEGEPLNWLNEGLSIIESGESQNDETWRNELESWLSKRPSQYEEASRLNQVNNLLGELSNEEDDAQSDFIQHTILLNLHLFYTNLS